MEIILTVSILFILGIISLGAYYIYTGTEASQKKLRRLMKANLMFFVPLIAFFVVTFVPEFTRAAGETASSGNGLGFIAAGLSTGLASLGAGVAVASVGSSAIGAVSEDPKILGKSMIFLGLADGIAIYGLIISIMILGRL